MVEKYDLETSAWCTNYLFNFTDTWQIQNSNEAYPLTIHIGEFIVFEKEYYQILSI